jgi:FMN-dependent oxidoreductase (nitrilotriacetate monooxygenase family)
MSLHFNAFLMGCGHHEAAWRLPESDPFANLDLGHWSNLAQIAERGAFDSVFLADGPALWGNAKHRPGGSLEPTVLLTALAGATSHIGLIATASTTYNDPYNLARRFASLDHISGGRAGWNIVTTANKAAAQNFGLDDNPSHRERYQRAAEFTDISIGLWDSWEDGAEIGDKAAGIYADEDRIHPIDFKGEYFQVRGPLNVPRTPQGRPLLVQAGSSEDGREFAARYAEAVFTAQQTLADAQDFYTDLKARARRLGRDPDQIKILPGLVPTIGSTEAEARALEDELEALIVPDYGLNHLAQILELPASSLPLDGHLPESVYSRPPIEGMQSRSQLVLDLARRDNLTVRQLIGRLGGGRGHRTFAGTPEQVADTIEEWSEAGAADGFNVMPAALPSGLEAFVEHVIPLLRKRGLFREEYTGRTLRDHYGIPRPASQYATPLPTPASRVPRPAPTPIATRGTRTPTPRRSWRTSRHGGRVPTRWALEGDSTHVAQVSARSPIPRLACRISRENSRRIGVDDDPDRPDVLPQPRGRDQRAAGEPRLCRRVRPLGGAAGRARRTRHRSGLRCVRAGRRLGRSADPRRRVASFRVERVQ